MKQYLGGILGEIVHPQNFIEFSEFFRWSQLRSQIYSARAARALCEPTRNPYQFHLQFMKTTQSRVLKPIFCSPENLSFYDNFSYFSFSPGKDEASTKTSSKKMINIFARHFSFCKAHVDVFLEPIKTSLSDLGWLVWGGGEEVYLLLPASSFFPQIKLIKYNFSYIGFSISTASFEWNQSFFFRWLAYLRVRCVALRSMKKPQNV